jgi:secreted protein with Ig-like and vWFA domain
MNQPNDPKHDEMADRLIDQALAEVLSGESPPDLADKILAAFEKQGYVSTQRKEPVMSKSKRGYRWAVGAAACLVVGATMAVIVPNLQNARESARISRDSVGVDFDMDTESVPASSASPPRESSEDTTQVLNQPLDVVIQPSVDGKPRDGSQRKPTRGKPDTKKPLRMMVTPRIVVEEEGEEVLAQPATPATSPLGQGPGLGGDKYDRVVENPFRAVKDQPLSTFSIDVDTASYANVRRFLMNEGRLPPPDAVRIEELINYFHYDYAGPKDDTPFAAHIDVAGCPWKPEHRLVRIGLKGKEVPAESRPPCNLVFLLDVSGSMDSPDKLPLVKAGMKLLADEMRENDRVAIVVYASAEGLVLPSTPGAQRQRILEAIGRLNAGGSTNGGAGIELAYRIAQENLIPKGVNRVVLCTDGDFNVGTTSTGDLTRMVEEKARSGVFLSVLGFGRGNLNDAMMETLSNKGNGNYAYIDGMSEARKVLVEQMGGTLVTIAKDVKIQVEFNPARVAAYRLIGYENRMLAAEDFNDDKKDAGEIGSGHTVTALYEIVPAGGKVDTPAVDPLKYQAAAQPPADKPAGNELLTVKLRYKEPDGDTSKRLEFPVVDAGAAFGKASPDFQFAAAVASLGMLLRGSEYKGTATYDAVLEIATAAKGDDPHGYRAELLEMVRRAKTLAGQ